MKSLSTEIMTITGVLVRNPYILPTVCYSTMRADGKMIELVAFGKVATALGCTSKGQAISVFGNYKYNAKKERDDFIISMFDAIAIISPQDD